MGDVMSVHEYSTALTALRKAQSDLMGLELAAARQALAAAQTSQAKVERRRRANTTAARLLRTAVEAERIAGLELLKSQSLESDELGRQRLIAATAELFDMDPEDVDREHHRKRPKGRPSRAALKERQEAKERVFAWQSTCHMGRSSSDREARV